MTLKEAPFKKELKPIQVATYTEKPKPFASQQAAENVGTFKPATA